jgi:hypothetical protein
LAGGEDAVSRRTVVWIVLAFIAILAIAVIISFLVFPP